MLLFLKYVVVSTDVGHGVAILCHMKLFLDLQFLEGGFPLAECDWLII
jgi:hypothetical protein